MQALFIDHRQEIRSRDLDSKNRFRSMHRSFSSFTEGPSRILSNFQTNLLVSKLGSKATNCRTMIKELGKDSTLFTRSKLIKVIAALTLKI